MRTSRIIVSAAAAVGAIFGMGAASAADLRVKARPMPPPPVYSWAGWHGGLNAGYGWGPNNDGSLTNFATTFGTPFAVTAGFVPSNLGLSPAGGFVGGQVGYDWQMGMAVFGVETDLQWSGIRANNILFVPAGLLVPSTTTSHDNLNWFGTLRGRVGIASIPRALFYLTGGLAYGGTNEGFSLVGTPPSAGTIPGNAGTTRVGWTAGAGAEWAITDRWTVRAEYLHLDLGTDVVRGFDSTGNFPGVFLDYSFPHRYDIVRAALNYRFNLELPVVAKY